MGTGHDDHPEIIELIPKKQHAANVAREIAPDIDASLGGNDLPGAESLRPVPLI
jgi:hypothetical protein